MGSKPKSRIKEAPKEAITKVSKAMVKFIPVIELPAVMPPWSYTAWDTYEKCPYQYYLSRIAKLPQGERGEPLIRGERIHKLGENFINGRDKQPAQELRLYRAELQEMREKQAIAEQGWAFTRSWEPVEYFKGVGSDGLPLWVRMKIDVHWTEDGGVLCIDDFKTGRVKEHGYEAQLELYAVGGFSMYEGVKKVVTRLLYLDHHVSPRMEYKSSEYPALKKTWEKRVRPLENDRKFMPKPSDGACRYCPYKASAGGPCVY